MEKYITFMRSIGFRDEDIKVGCRDCTIYHTDWMCGICRTMHDLMNAVFNIEWEEGDLAFYAIVNCGCIRKLEWLTFSQVKDVIEFAHLELCKLNKEFDLWSIDFKNDNGSKYKDLLEKKFGVYSNRRGYCIEQNARNIYHIKDAVFTINTDNTVKIIMSCCTKTSKFKVYEIVLLEEYIASGWGRLNNENEKNTKLDYNILVKRYFPNIQDPIGRTFGFSNFPLCIIYSDNDSNIIKYLDDETIIEQFKKFADLKFCKLVEENFISRNKNNIANEIIGRECKFPFNGWYNAKESIQIKKIDKYATHCCIGCQTMISYEDLCFIKFLSKKYKPSYMRYNFVVACLNCGRNRLAPVDWDDYLCILKTQNKSRIQYKEMLELVDDNNEDLREDLINENKEFNKLFEKQSVLLNEINSAKVELKQKDEELQQIRQTREENIINASKTRYNINKNHKFVKEYINGIVDQCNLHKTMLNNNENSKLIEEHLDGVLEIIHPYKCIICLEVRETHHTLNCGHIFCGNCVNTISEKCPSCRATITTRLKLYTD